MFTPFQFEELVRAVPLWSVHLERIDWLLFEVLVLRLLFTQAVMLIAVDGFREAEVGMETVAFTVPPRLKALAILPATRLIPLPVVPLFALATIRLSQFHLGPLRLLSPTS